MRTFGSGLIYRIVTFLCEDHYQPTIANMGTFSGCLMRQTLEKTLYNMAQIASMLAITFARSDAVVITYFIARVCAVFFRAAFINTNSCQRGNP